ncbi:MAG: rRNA pseudouridine synthase [Ruminiclostridium sp.]|nr:rRNA pseudouridine synthase [Ruminiclostridium sp.]
MEKVRIQKIISDSGYCSRRKAEQLIADGHVKLNGHPVKLGDKADPKTDIITVGGERIKAGGVTLRYIKLYKPRGYVTTMQDEQGRKSVTELLDGIEERVYPVGRLDRNSEGLLLLTNDGNFANDIMHPRKHIPKTYRVTVAEKVTEDVINRLMTGVEIEENVMTAPCEVTVVTEEQERTVLQFTIYEGKNRQIRRMCEAVQLTVRRLRRVNIGGVKLGMLKPGEYADLTKQEMQNLRSAMGVSAKTEYGGSKSRRTGGKR